MILLKTKLCFYVSTQYLSNKNIINIFIKFNIGDWGLGIGDWAQSPIPDPQSPYYLQLISL